METNHQGKKKKRKGNLDKNDVLWGSTRSTFVPMKMTRFPCLCS